MAEQTFQISFDDLVLCACGKNAVRARQIYDASVDYIHRRLRDMPRFVLLDERAVGPLKQAFGMTWASNAAVHIPCTAADMKPIGLRWEEGLDYLLALADDTAKTNELTKLISLFNFTIAYQYNGTNEDAGDVWDVLMRFSFTGMCPLIQKTPIGLVDVGMLKEGHTDSGISGDVVAINEESES